ncbi:hypothetical protein ACE1OC_40910 [Streptomyces sp. DSM 116496]|uniref:hypothetical protein n=1 Tax=Streptomyces stoeckheimensis TaxID=3344656 RepID=UPI0038B2EA01
MTAADAAASASSRRPTTRPAGHRRRCSTSISFRAATRAFFSQIPTCVPWKAAFMFMAWVTVMPDFFVHPTRQHLGDDLYGVQVSWETTPLSTVKRNFFPA